MFYEKLSIDTVIGDILSCYLGGTPNTKIPEFWDGDINKTYNDRKSLIKNLENFPIEPANQKIVDIICDYI